MYKMIMEVLKRIESGVEFFPEIETVEIDFSEMNDADLFIFDKIRKELFEFEVRVEPEDMVTEYNIYGRKLRIKIW